jgi:GNAT superfamily N-acetyltransferase
MPTISMPSAPPMRFRIANNADIAPLSQVIDAAVQCLRNGEYSPQQGASALEYVFGVDRRLIADGTCYVAEVVTEGCAHLVGCGAWSRRRSQLFGKESELGKSDPEQLLNPAIEPARLHAFYVHPAWTRRGIARELVSMCEAAARDQGFRTLELATTLVGGRMYERCGFIELERVDYELPDGVRLPVVHMLKPLAASRKGQIAGL